MRGRREECQLIIRGEREKEKRSAEIAGGKSKAAMW